MKISYLCNAFGDALRVKAAAQHSSSELGSAFALALHLSLSMRTMELARQAKVIKEAALRSGVSRGVMQACWDAAGEVIKAWATEGHTRTALLEPHPHPSLTPNPSPTGEGDYHGEGSSYYTLEGRRIVS